MELDDIEVNDLIAKYEGDDPHYAINVLTEIHADNWVPFDPIVQVPLRDGDHRILITFDENELEIKLFIDGRLRAFDDETILLIEQLYF